MNSVATTKMTTMKPKDALKLIRAVKKLGVTSMKFGTLEFELSTEPCAQRPALKVSKKKILEQQEQNDVQENYETAKDDLSVMHVEDPAGFEQAIADQELGDSGGEKLEEAHTLET